MITVADIKGFKEVSAILAKKKANYFKDYADENYRYVVTKIIKLINPLFPYRNYQP